MIDIGGRTILKNLQENSVSKTPQLRQWLIEFHILQCVGKWKNCGALQMYQDRTGENEGERAFRQASFGAPYTIL